MDHDSFLGAARVAFDLASTVEVRTRWRDDSSCTGMTVGGLAHHLLQQASHTVRLLGAAPDAAADPPIPLLEHYRRAAWVEAGPDDEANVSVSEEADAAAAAGPDVVLADGAAALARLPTVLRAHRIPGQVRIPWQGWSLTTDDFLVGRAMEIVVHADDLASSVGLDTPAFPEDVVTDVVALLAAVAVRRHGQAAVVRALSRPQRAPADVSAF